MAVQVFRSTTGGAPAAPGAVAGGLIPILDYCLVTNMSTPWTKTVYATNQVSYTQPAGSSNGFVIQIDDTNANYARVTAWEALTAFNTGTNEFPSQFQQKNSFATTINDGAGAYINRDSNSATYNNWRMFANGNIFHFVMQWSGNINYWTGFSFGDYVAYRAGDAFNTVFASGGLSSSGTGYMPLCYASQGLGTPLVNSFGFVTQPRPYTQVGTSQLCGIYTDVRSFAQQAGASTVPYPTKVGGAFLMSPVWINDSLANDTRGLIPGIWHSAHSGSLFPDKFTFSAASGALAGRSFESAGFTNSAGGQLWFETTNTWGGF